MSISDQLLSPRDARLLAVTAVWLAFNIWLFHTLAAPSAEQWQWYGIVFSTMFLSAGLYPHLGGRLSAIIPLYSAYLGLAKFENKWFRAMIFSIYFNAALNLSAHHEHDFVRGRRRRQAEAASAKEGEGEATPSDSNREGGTPTAVSSPSVEKMSAFKNVSFFNTSFRASFCNSLSVSFRNGVDAQDAHSPAEILLGGFLVTSLDRMRELPTYWDRFVALCSGAVQFGSTAAYLAAVGQVIASPPEWAAGMVDTWREIVYSTPFGIHYSDLTYVVVFGLLTMVTVHIFLLFVEAGHVCLLAIFGWFPEPIQNQPLTHSQSAKEFWSERWNSVVHRLLKDGVYRPVRRATRSSVIGQIAAFLVSSILHVGFAAGFYMGPVDLVGVGAFFMGQGFILVLETLVCENVLPCTIRPTTSATSPGVTKWRAINIVWLYAQAFAFVGLIASPIAKAFWMSPPAVEDASLMLCAANTTAVP